MPSSNTLLKPEVKQVVDAIVLALPEMVNHVSTKPEEEVVGAVMADGFIVKLLNEAKDRTATFAISPHQLKHLDSLVAVYHSHPGGSEMMSAADERGLNPINAVVVTTEAVVLWWYHELVGYHRVWDLYYGIE